MLRHRMKRSKADVERTGGRQAGGHRNEPAPATPLPLLQSSLHIHTQHSACAISWGCVMTDEEFGAVVGQIDELSRRMSRCEAMVATLIATGGVLTDESANYLRLMYGTNSPDYFAGFLTEMLKPENRMPSEAALSRWTGMLYSQLRSIQRDFYAYAVSTSFGIDSDAVPLPRLAPVRFYLSSGSETVLASVNDALGKVADAIGYTPADEFPAERGSWWKRWTWRSKQALSRPQVQECFDKLQHGAELHALQKPQAEVDRVAADGIATLLNALSDVAHAAMQCGSILLVKTLDRAGDQLVAVRRLSVQEMIQLEKSPNLLNSPQTVLSELERLVTRPDDDTPDGDTRSEEPRLNG